MTRPTPTGQPARTSRRGFLKASAALGAAAYLSTVPNVHAGGSGLIRVGLIGCGSPRGGRGRGAATNAVNAGPDVKLTALADLFRDHLDFTRDHFKKIIPDKLDVPDSRCFVGWNAYKDLIHCKDVDVVILATPPHFRPLHLQEAVAAGKHAFVEKPVAVDAPGVRSMLKTVEEARQKNLSIVSGLCWRYDKGMQETFKRVRDGAIGDILTLQTTYNTGALWSVPRQPQWSDMEWQLRNWLYFTWLSGDFNVEQHIHSLDKMAWVLGDQYPVKAVGSGGRQVRISPEFGHIYDHHTVTYDYPNGVKVFSACRQMAGCAQEIGDYIWGTKGVCHIDASRHRFSIKPHKGSRWVWKLKSGQQDRGMYQNEHDAWIASIRAAKPINNGEYMARSTLMAIMGRMATYTGQVIDWDKALASQENLTPVKYEFGPLQVPAVARPGFTRFI